MDGITPITKALPARQDASRLAVPFLSFVRPGKFWSGPSRIGRRSVIGRYIWAAVLQSQMDGELDLWK
jgi:hypothetical protein